MTPDFSSSFNGHNFFTHWVKKFQVNRETKTLVVMRVSGVLGLREFQGFREKYKGNHLLFLKNFDVAFSNNISERDLRKCKNRQKLIGGFRSTDGATLFADILSVVETAKRLKKNVFDTILGLFRSSVPAFDFAKG